MPYTGVRKILISGEHIARCGLSGEVLGEVSGFIGDFGVIILRSY